jgi:hypothetical protein
MKVGLSMVRMLVTPSGEAVARMKVWWAFRTVAAYGQSKEYAGWFLVYVVRLGRSRDRKRLL